MRKTIIQLFQTAEVNPEYVGEPLVHVIFANFEDNGDPAGPATSLSLPLSSEDNVDTLKIKFIYKWHEEYGSEPNEFVWLDETP